MGVLPELVTGGNTGGNTSNQQMQSCKATNQPGNSNQPRWLVTPIIS